MANTEQSKQREGDCLMCGHCAATGQEVAAPQASQSDLIEQIADLFNIGGFARKDYATILANVKNCKDYADRAYLAASQPVSGAMTDEEVISRMQAAGFVFGHTQEGELRKFIGTLLDARALLSASGQAGQSEREAEIDRLAWNEALSAAARYVNGRLAGRAEGSELWLELGKIERGIRALSSIPAQQTEAPVNVPSGWKLVPVEPTQEMHDAGRAALARGSVPMEKVYRAMLAAAPAPAQTQQSDCKECSRKQAQIDVLYSEAKRYKEVAEAVQQSEKDAPNFKQFAADVLDQSRKFGCADVDGSDIQELAIKYRLLVERDVTEPCGEQCECAELGFMPGKCFFYAPEVLDAIAQEKVKS